MSSGIGIGNALRELVRRANLGQLSTSGLGLPKQVDGLKVYASLGQGTPARVPWIAFVGDDMRVRRGIYPVYLYYKDKGVIVLAYGVSETEAPPADWPDEVRQRKISDVLGDVPRYGNSYVFKVYRVEVSGENVRLLESSAQLSDDDLERDLGEILNYYGNSVLPRLAAHEAGGAPSRQERLYFVDGDVERRLRDALKVSNVLIVGPPGVGKTQLAKAVASEGCGWNVVTANSLWFRRDVIGGETLKGNEVSWRSGFLIRAYNAAAKCVEDGKKEMHYLIIDEINRADVDKAFGEFLTIFSSVSPDGWSIPSGLLEEIRRFPGDVDEEAKRFLNYYEKHGDEPLRRIRVIATMNLTDMRNLFLVGQALLRRFAVIRISCPSQGKDNDEIKQNVERLVDEMCNLEGCDDQVKGMLKDVAVKAAQGLSEALRDEPGGFCLSPAAVRAAIRLIMSSSGRRDRALVVESLKEALGYLTLDERATKALNELS